jgi:hypothetical protein
VVAGDDAPVSEAELLSTSEIVHRAGVDAALIERLRLDGVIGTGGTDDRPFTTGDLRRAQLIGACVRASEWTTSSRPTGAAC